MNENTWKNIIYVQFEAEIQSTISSIFTNSEKMRGKYQNVPQYDGIWKCSSGSRILRSQFFPGLCALGSGGQDKTNMIFFRLQRSGKILKTLFCQFFVDPTAKCWEKKQVGAELCQSQVKVGRVKLVQFLLMRLS